MSTPGYYRWSINAFAYARNATALYDLPIPKFDEPAISMSVPERLAPHRVAIVGESLFVHSQVCGAVILCAVLCLSSWSAMPQQRSPRCWVFRVQ
jgi:hypothetical protein